MTRRQPPQNDPVEEQARFECMRLIAEGTLDNWTVFIQREAGAPWSKIRDAARRKQQQEVAEVGVAKAIDPACEYWRQPTNSVTKRAIMTPSGSARIISCTEPSCRSYLANGRNLCGIRGRWKYLYWAVASDIAGGRSSSASQPECPGAVC